MAAGNNAPFQGLLGHTHIHVHCLLARFAQFQKNVVVRHAGEHACFIKLHVPHQLEVFLDGPDPGRHTGKAVAPRPADFDALAVLGRIQKKLRSRDQPCLSAQAVQKVKHFCHLLHRVRRARLLAVAEGGVGDAHLFRRAGSQQNFVKRGAADARIRKKVTVKLRLFRFLHGQCAASGLMYDRAHGAAILSGAPGAVKIVP